MSERSGKRGNITLYERYETPQCYMVIRIFSHVFLSTLPDGSQWGGCSSRHLDGGPRAIDCSDVRWRRVKPTYLGEARTFSCSQTKGYITKCPTPRGMPVNYLPSFFGRKAQRSPGLEYGNAHPERLHEYTRNNAITPSTY